MKLYTVISFVLLVTTSYALYDDLVSTWSAVKTDEAAWQDACGHVKRVGSVCLSAKYGDRNMYGVSRFAKLDVVFSGKGHYFHAYCPNLDKGEYPYEINYGTETELAYFTILGRHSGDTCCRTQYTDIHHNVHPVQCIEPAVVAGALFPPVALGIHQ